VGASFPFIYSGNFGFHEDLIHLDFLKPYPIREIQQYVDGYNVKIPLIFVNTSNHALAPHDNNREMPKTLFHHKTNDSTLWRYGTRLQVEKKYKNSVQYRQRKRHAFGYPINKDSKKVMTRVSTRPMSM